MMPLRTRLVVLSLVAAAAVPAAAMAQAVTVETAATAGASTEDVTAVATQLRAFGDAPRRIRYFVEATWAARRGDGSDAFGGAYPYGARLQVMEAYAEGLHRSGRLLAAVRAGRYRVPFGISSGSDHGYTGFLRAPLIRYEGYYALSNNFLEHGVDVVAGVPELTIEASLGTPADTGEAVRPPGLDRVLRVQAALGPAIVGVSDLVTRPYQSPAFAAGTTRFHGVDVRWMQGGVQLRGEWLTGRPWDGVSTTGWYADALIHPRRFGPVTAVARVEQLDYDTAPRYALHARRQTLGARLRLTDGLSAQVNVLRTETSRRPRRTVLDAGLTYTVRP